MRKPFSRVAFVKTGSVTHGINMDQRFVELTFQQERWAVERPGLRLAPADCAAGAITCCS